MTQFNPKKVHVKYNDLFKEEQTITPRKYTLTHSDITAELFLTIGKDFDYNQIANLYTRVMRDEVLAEWLEKEGKYELHIYVHISGGFVFGWAGLRNRIIRSHLPLVFQTIRFGDQKLFEEFPFLDDAQIIVHFNSKRKRFNKVEQMGHPKNYITSD